MNRVCKCGGRMTLDQLDVIDCKTKRVSFGAKCDRCGVKVTQRKRRSKREREEQERRELK